MTVRNACAPPTIRAPCRVQLGDTAQRGTAATKQPRTRTKDEHEDEKNLRGL